jgi:hypothetical protein
MNTLFAHPLVCFYKLWYTFLVIFLKNFTIRLQMKYKTKNVYKLIL